MRSRHTSFAAAALLLLGVVASASCNKSHRGEEEATRWELLGKAESLASSHASMDECREALGEPAMVFDIEPYILWKYHLPKPGRPVDDLLTLVFIEGDLTLRKVYVQDVDSFEAPLPGPGP